MQFKNQVYNVRYADIVEPEIVKIVAPLIPPSPEPPESETTATEQTCPTQYYLSNSSVSQFSSERETEQTAGSPETPASVQFLSDSKNPSISEVWSL